MVLNPGSSSNAQARLSPRIYALHPTYPPQRQCPCLWLAERHRSRGTAWAIAVAERRPQDLGSDKLPNSVFCLSRLLGKNLQKLGNLLPDVGGIASQHQVGLCGQFVPQISTARFEPCRPTVVRQGVPRKLIHVDSPFSGGACSMPTEANPC